MQVPEATKFATLFVTVHTAGVAELTDTGRLELAAAATTAELVAYGAGIGLMEIVWVASFTVKLCVTDVAAA